MTREEKTRIEEEVEEGTCEFMHVHEAIVEKVERVMPDEQELLDLSEFFKIFGDAGRIKILCALVDNELCVNDMVELLNMSQSAVSHQLRLLRQNDAVKFRKDGKTVYYSLDDEHVSVLLKKGIEHIKHKNGYEEE